MYFLHTVRKVHTVRPAGEKQPIYAFYAPRGEN